MDSNLGGVNGRFLMQTRARQREREGGREERDGGEREGG
jgi:hypothetical protein